MKKLIATLALSAALIASSADARFPRGASSGSGPTQLPLQANLVAHFDQASGVTTSGSNVTSWTDTVNGIVAGTAVGSTAPTLTTSDSIFNGARSIRCNNGGGLSIATPGALKTAIDSATYTVAIVFHTHGVTTNNGQGAMLTASAGGVGIFDYSADGNTVFFGPNVPTQVNYTGSTFSTMGSLAQVLTGSSSGTWQAFFINGTAYTTAVTTVPVTGGNAITICDNASNTAAGVGDIADILVWNTALTPAQYLQFEKWARNRYSQALPWAGLPAINVFFGDSQTAGVGASTVANQAQFMAAQTLSLTFGQFEALGIGGITSNFESSSMNSEAPLLVDPLPAAFGVPINLVGFEWVNENSFGASGSVAFSDAVTYLTARKAVAGIRTVWGDSLSLAADPVANRATYDGLWASAIPSTVVDSFMSLSSDTHIGVNGSYATFSTGGDGVHLTDATQPFLATLFVSGINALSPSNFNGGLVQTSLSAAFLGSGENIPINRWMDGRDWVTTSGANPVDVSTENSNGFPSNNTTLASTSGWRAVFTIPSKTEKPGNSIFSWTGGGSTTWDTHAATSVVSISGSGCTISGTQVSGTTCTATINDSGNTTVAIDILSVSGGGPTSVQYYNVNDAAMIAAGNVCKGTQFAATIGNTIGVIRDLNRSDVNNTFEAVWADRTPVTAWNWSANNYFPQSLITTNSFVNTAANQYTLAFSTFALTDKAHVIVKPPTIVAPSTTTTAVAGQAQFSTLSYNNSTGLVTLTMQNPIGFLAGDQIIISGIAGSGNLAALEGTFTSLSASGTSVTYQAATGLGSFTIFGGTLNTLKLYLNSTAGIVVGMVAGDNNNGNAFQPSVKVTAVGTNTVTFSISPFTGTINSGDTIFFSPMLNINGTGSLPLVNSFANAFGTSNVATTIFPNWSIITYDAQLGVLMMGNANGVNTGIPSAWPPEIFTQCANEVGAHPWFVLPPYSVDSPTNYATQLATMVKANLLPGLIPRFEGPNETWNNGNFATQYAFVKEWARTHTQFDSANWYGRAISQAGQAVSAVYSNDRTKYKVEACMQQGGPAPAIAVSSGTYNSSTGLVTLTLASTPPFFTSGEPFFVRGLTGTGSIASANGPVTSAAGSTGTTLTYTIATGLTLTIASSSPTAFVEGASPSENNKLTSPEYVSNGGSAAYNWITDICPTNYYGSAFVGTTNEIGWAYQFTHGATQSQQDTLVNEFLAGAESPGFTNNGGNLFFLQNTLFPNDAAYVATWVGTANIGWTMYEGAYGSNAGCGYSSAGCGPLNSNLNNKVSSVSLGTTTTLTVGATASQATFAVVSNVPEMTINGTITGSFQVGYEIYGSSVVPATTIVGVISGTGGAGTVYQIDTPQTNATTVAITTNPAWNFICNTASLCTGGAPTTALTFGGGCGLNGLDPAVLSATPTTITVNVNSTGFTGCTTGTAAYDGAGGQNGYAQAFEIGVKENTNPINLQATELSYLQSFFTDGGRFPALYDWSDTTDWGKYNPDVFQTDTPSINAAHAFQASP